MTLTNSATLMNVVVDLSHNNGSVDFAKIKAAGVLGVIHKATQGISYTDPKYLSRKQQALDVGLMWGAYHFGTGDDGQQQAQYFLKAVNPGPKDLLVLDFEENTSGKSLTLADAEKFVTYINQITGTWPGLYSGVSYLTSILGSVKNPTLANCWLWLARYGKEPVAPITWANWMLWQYTDGINGDEPHTLDGVGACDRDKFNGTETQLKQLWHD